MERSQRPLDGENGPEQEINLRAEQLQHFIDVQMHELSNPYLSDIEHELAMIDLNEIVDHEKEQLNEADPSVGQMVRVTGQIHRAYYDEMTRKDEVEVVNVHGEEMESAGFTLYRIKGDDGAVRHTVGHLFRNQAPTQTSSVNGLIFQAKIYYSFAPHGSVKIERQHTDYEVRRHLETTAPDELFELESRLLNAESPEQAIMLLSELNYPDGALDDVTQACLVRYANQTLETEHLPLLKVDAANSYRRTVIGIPMTLSFKQELVSIVARFNELTLCQDKDDQEQLYRWAVRGNVEAADDANQGLVGCPDFALSTENIRNISRLKITD